MPKYDFSCTSCDHVTEIHLTYDSIEKPNCSKCGQPLVKSFTPPAIHFKGGGWGGQ